MPVSNDAGIPRPRRWRAERRPRIPRHSRRTPGGSHQIDTYALSRKLTGAAPAVPQLGPDAVPGYHSFRPALKRFLGATVLNMTGLGIVVASHLHVPRYGCLPKAQKASGLTRRYRCGFRRPRQKCLESRKERVQRQPQLKNARQLRLVWSPIRAETTTGARQRAHKSDQQQVEFRRGCRKDSEYARRSQLALWPPTARLRVAHL